MGTCGEEGGPAKERHKAQVGRVLGVVACSAEEVRQDGAPVRCKIRALKLT